MTAPDTSVEREAKRHRPALIGIAAAVLIACVAGVTLFMAPNPENDATPEAGVSAVGEVQTQQGIAGTE